MKEFSHESVLLHEAVDGLSVKPDGVYMDGTAGGGGHSFEIAARLTGNGRLYAVDQDEDAISAASERLSIYGTAVKIVRNNFRNLKLILEQNGESGLDGILLDIGVSSYQIDTPERGFSYMHDAPLDMRMDRKASRSAYDIINGYDEKKLAEIFFEYGEERFSRRIAAQIVKKRADKPIETTFELNDIIASCVRGGDGHPSKRVFQALRIEVNDELGALRQALSDACDSLFTGGRIAVITFHSLEDRIVKQFFAQKAKGCTCPPKMPVCTCGGKSVVKLISSKPILPSPEEQERNPRSRSAKLRVAEKL